VELRKRPHSPTPRGARRLRRPVLVVAFDPQSGTLVAGGDQATVRLWNIDPAEVTAHICSTSGELITNGEWKKYVPDVPYRLPC
jgi:hypothetical protein